MKAAILFALVLLAHALSAQIFTEVPELTDLAGVRRSAVAFADVDGDGAPDLLITGQRSGGSIAKLYLNDGCGHFTEKAGTPFDGVISGSVAFADVDGDGDSDLLITGVDSANVRIAKLYLNDGAGNFAETNTPFDGVAGSAVAFADVDGDGDNDLLITGMNNSNDAIAKLYLNDGGGDFAEQISTPFESVWGGSVAFADIDGDGDSDLLITGTTDSIGNIAKLYLNDGAGNFTEKTGTPFEEVFFSSVAFADVDGDGDKDLLITGLNNSNEPIAKLYFNEGAGFFTEHTNTPFEGVWNGSAAFADVDGDGDSDLLITGRDDSNQPIAKLYLNGGLNVFTEHPNTPFDGVYSSSVAFADVNGDGHTDLITTGLSFSGGYISNLYLNDAGGNFTERSGPLIRGISQGAIAFADVDGDGTKDLLLAGNGMSKLYLNRCEGGFAEKMGTPFPGISLSAAAFADVDGDGDSDLLIAGKDQANVRLAKLYLNDGSGHFTEKLGTPFAGVEGGAVAFADLDGDGDTDLMITGLNASQQRITKCYLNDGLGHFTESITSFEGVEIGSVTFSDVDGDGDPDLLITGLINSGGFIAKLYLNDGLGHFSEKTGTPFEEVVYGAMAFSDVDADGDNDLLITGMNPAGTRVAKLYLNDGGGNFTEKTGTPFDGVAGSSVAFADVDEDGDSDLLITGQNSANVRIAKLYLNDGAGNFAEHTGTPFEGIAFGAVAFSDIDGDGDSDLFLTGQNASEQHIAKLYRNERLTTSITEQNPLLPFEFTLYPNPVTSNTLHIRFESTATGPLQIRLYGLQGRLLKQQQEWAGIGSQTLNLDVAAMAPGAYLIRLEAGGRSGSRVVLVQ